MNKNKLQNVWSNFKVKKELTKVLKEIIKKVINNEKLSDKEIEFLKEVSK